MARVQAKRVKRVERMIAWVSLHQTSKEGTQARNNGIAVQHCNVSQFNSQ